MINWNGKVVLDKDGKPEVLYCPDAEHFTHNAWVRPNGEVNSPHILTPAMIASCSTTACLVGSVGLAFGTGVKPETFKSRPGIEFMAGIVRRCGASVDADAMLAVSNPILACSIASNVFEGTGFACAVALTPQQVADAWRDEARAWGYDV